MTTEVQTVRLTRWCGDCSSPATAEGSHLPNGKFDPSSVYVSEREIRLAMAANGGCRNRDHVVYCIALGKHVGAYEA